MDTATLIMVVVGLLLVAFAAVAVISCVRGASKVDLPAPKAGEPELSSTARLQEQLVILNRN